MWSSDLISAREGVLAFQIPDRAVSNPGEDFLGRDGFAKATADLITGAPQGTSLRLGIYGGWGEGKTSVLKLIEHYVRESGGRCVWLRPWASATREELLDELLLALALEFELDTKALRRTQQQAAIARRLRASTGTDIRAAVADALVGSSVEGFFQRRSEAHASEILTQVESLVADKKLVVFIDDLDRVRPHLVPELLLTLREVLDHPNFFYVMALAPDVVTQGLEAINKAWGGQQQFLEKIIELPRWLPIPSSSDWTNFLEELLRQLGGSEIKKAIEEVVAFVPRNPRKAKLFLRHVASLSYFLGRFDAEELDWRGLSLCLMMATEFPTETRSLVDDDEAVSAIEYGPFHADEKPEEKAKKVELIKRHAPKGDVDQARFLELATAMRERSYLSKGVHPLSRLLQYVVKEPPVFTWKEVGVLIEDYRSRGAMALTDWMARPQKDLGRRVSALFDILIRWRGNLIDRAANEELRINVVKHLDEAGLFLRVIADLIHREGVFQRNLCGWRQYAALYEQANHWSHFDEPDYNAMARTQERALLESALPLLPLDERIELLNESLRPDEHRHTADAPPNEFLALTSRITESIERDAATKLVDLFRSPGGLDEMWGTKGRTLKNILFDPDSYFHKSPHVRAALSEVGDLAAGSDAIQSNFVSYLRMLMYAVFEGGSFPRRESAALLKDRDLVAIVWRGALVHPLNHRTVGTIRGHRNNLIANGYAEDMFPLPEWWQQLERTFFAPRARRRPSPEGKAASDSSDDN